jgi:hypothetical protein
MAIKKVEVAKAATPKKVTAKPAAKKVAPVKKVAAKKAVTKTTKKSLVYAGNNTSFWVANGEVLNSLVALRDSLAKMDAAVYKKHVSSEKNDFANWVGAVLNDAACAKDLLGAKTPASAKTVVVRHLKLYTY